MMNFALKMMNFALKMMNFVLQMTNSRRCGSCARARVRISGLNF